MDHLQLQDGRIEYQWVDPGSGTSAGVVHRQPVPLVFLHEGLGCVAMWGRFPQALATATGARCLLYSRFGYGGSDPLTAPRTPRFLHDEALSVLPQVLRRLDVASPVLVGHSDGASIALIRAAVRPGSTAGLILEAPHVFAEQLTVNGVAAIRARFREDAEFRRAFGRYHRDAAMVVARWSDAWLSPSFHDWSIEALLPAITCPVLLLQSEHDPYGSFAHIRRIEEAAAGPVRTVVLPGADHAPHRGCRVRVLREMTDFVASLAVA